MRNLTETLKAIKPHEVITVEVNGREVAFAKYNHTGLIVCLDNHLRVEWSTPEDMPTALAKAEADYDKSFDAPNPYVDNSPFDPDFL